MTHLDLFSGIGGFAYAADQVFGDVKHTFCDNDKYCRAVLAKHWPESEIYESIQQITADVDGAGLQRQDRPRAKGRSWASERVDLLTGGFPCQPYSAAGLRRGTADDRHLWPEMLRVIRLTEPEWVIAENVRGLITWNEGLVLEQVCADLETEGYEVQPFIIPAVAVNAPHRRDRVWFVAHSTNVAGRRGGTCKDNSATGKIQERNEVGQPSEPSALWDYPWAEAATELCSVDDGLPVGVGGLKLSKSQHHKAQLQAYGNAIVPQVAMQIMQSIKQAT